MKYKAFEARNLDGKNITVDEQDMVPLIQKIRKEIISFYQDESIEDDDSDWDITDVVELGDSYLWTNNILKKYNCSEDSESQSATPLWIQLENLILWVELDVLKSDDEIRRCYFERYKLLRHRGYGRKTMESMEKDLLNTLKRTYPKTYENLLEIEF